MCSITHFLNIIKLSNITDRNILTKQSKAGSASSETVDWLIRSLQLSEKALHMHRMSYLQGYLKAKIIDVDSKEKYCTVRELFRTFGLQQQSRLYDWFQTGYGFPNLQTITTKNFPQILDQRTDLDPYLCLLSP